MRLVLALAVVGAAALRDEERSNVPLYGYIYSDRSVRHIEFFTAFFSGPFHAHHAARVPLVEAPDRTGCSVDFPTGAFRGKAVLVERGECEFTNKTQNLVRLGAEAVVFSNFDDGMFGLVHDPSRKHLFPLAFLKPVVLVRARDAAALKAAIRLGNGTTDIAISPQRCDSNGKVCVPVALPEEPIAAETPSAGQARVQESDAGDARPADAPTESGDDLENIDLSSLDAEEYESGSDEASATAGVEVEAEVGAEGVVTLERLDWSEALRRPVDAGVSEVVSIRGEGVSLEGLAAHFSGPLPAGRLRVVLADPETACGPDGDWSPADAAAASRLLPRAVMAAPRRPLEEVAQRRRRQRGQPREEEEAEKAEATAAEAARRAAEDEEAAAAEADRAALRAEYADSWGGAVVIVRRGQCTFAQKAAFVQAAGAAAMLAVNTDGGLQPMLRGDDALHDHFTLAAAMLTEEGGNALIGAVQTALAEGRVPGVELAPNTAVRGHTWLALMDEAASPGKWPADAAGARARCDKLLRYNSREAGTGSAEREAFVRDRLCEPMLQRVESSGKSGVE